MPDHVANIRLGEKNGKNLKHKDTKNLRFHRRIEFPHFGCSLAESFHRGQSLPGKTKPHIRRPGPQVNRFVWNADPNP